jgi:hypothetical protein
LELNVNYLFFIIAALFVTFSLGKCLFFSHRLQQRAVLGFLPLFYACGLILFINEFILKIDYLWANFALGPAKNEVIKFPSLSIVRLISVYQFFI